MSQLNAILTTIKKDQHTGLVMLVDYVSQLEAKITKQEERLRAVESKRPENKPQGGGSGFSIG